MRIQESAENYLETILVLRKKNGNVRSIDIAHELNFSKPSISRAMKLLRENDFIEVDSNGFITLTKSGSEIAEEMYVRHTTLANYLIVIGVDEETAMEDACRIEHVISQQTFEKIRQHKDKLEGQIDMLNTDKI